jgi:hypothetical protein
MRITELNKHVLDMDMIMSHDIRGASCVHRRNLEVAPSRVFRAYGRIGVEYRLRSDGQG